MQRETVIMCVCVCVPKRERQPVCYSVCGGETVCVCGCVGVGVMQNMGEREKS